MLKYLEQGVGRGGPPEPSAGVWARWREAVGSRSASLPWLGVLGGREDFGGASLRCRATWLNAWLGSRLGFLLDAALAQAAVCGARCRVPMLSTPVKPHRDAV